MTLPPGFRVRLAPDILTADGGRLLVGGSPLTAMRLTARAQDLISRSPHQDTVTVVDAASAHLADRLLATNLGVPDLGDLPTISAQDLTVVIPVRDRPAQLDRTLSALAPLRCVVVDDASLDPEPVAQVATTHGADLVSLAVNAGPAGARNAGLATVSTPYVAFVDSDVEVSAAALLAMAGHFADPEVALVGPHVVGVARGQHPAWFERYDAAASSLDLGTTAGTVRPGAAVAWLPSACLVGRAEALSAGFDDSLRVGEDVDLVWRLVDAGHRVRYDPTVVAFHDTRATLRGWLGRKFVYGTGGAGLAARHGDKLAPAVLTPTYAVAAAALLVRTRWALPVTAVAVALGARSIRSSLPGAAGSPAIATRLAARGMVWAVRQESALVVRHWWPAALVGALASRRLRRAVATAVVVDAAVAVREHWRADPRPAIPAMAAGRRLDDLAYGAGLWWGVLRARSVRALLPRRPGARPGA